MSKPVKNLITQSYKKQFGDLDGAVLIDIRGVASNNNNKLRANLAQKKVKVTVVKNSLAKRAFAGTKLQIVEQLIDGPTALAYGGDSVVSVREVFAQLKGIENLKVKGALMDGELYSADKVEMLSKFPTRGEAQAQVIQIFLAPASQIIGAALSAGAAIAGILKTIEEKVEKGEPAAATA